MNKGRLLLIVASVLVAALTTMAAVSVASTKEQIYRRRQKSHRHLRQRNRTRKNHRSLAASSGNYCGSDWMDAKENCNFPCPSGSDSDCGPGMKCFKYVECIPPDDDYFLNLVEGGGEQQSSPAPSAPATRSPNYVPFVMPVPTPNQLANPNKNYCGYVSVYYTAVEHMPNVYLIICIANW